MADMPSSTEAISPLPAPVHPAIENYLRDLGRGTDHPEIWQLARQRIRPGGLYIADNVLWHE